MPARDEGVFVVVVTVRNNRPSKVLLQLRKDTGLHDGKFGFPGGKRDNNERWEVTAARELYEETGLIFSRKSFQQFCRRIGGKDQDGNEWRCTFYLLESWCGKPDVKEKKKHNKIEWYSVDKLPKNVVPIVHEVISALMEKYNYAPEK